MFGIQINQTLKNSIMKKAIKILGVLMLLVFTALSFSSCRG
jgi:hypothetical protein